MPRSKSKTARLVVLKAPWGLQRAQDAELNGHTGDQAQSHRKQGLELNPLSAEGRLCPLEKADEKKATHG